MAGRPCISVVFMISVLVTGMNVLAQTPPASTSCTSSINSLSPCFSFLTGASNAAAGPACCSALATVVANAATCLCQLFGTNTPLGFPINQTRVLILPGLCNVNTPPLTQCTASGGGVPVNPPVAAPPASGGGVPVNPPVAAPPGSSPTVVIASPGVSPTGNPPTTGVGVPPADSPSVPSADSPSVPSSDSNPGKPTTGGSSPSNNGRPSTNVNSRADALFTPSAFHLVGVLVACFCM